MAGDVSRAIDERAVHTDALDDVRHGAAPLDLCRLTVLAQSVQIDLALPTDVPTALLIPGIVELIGSRGTEDRGTGNLGAGNGGSAHGRPWVLSKVGQPPLAGTLTLAEAAIRDGELLVLGTADSPAPPTLFDDLMHAVATTGESRSGLWTARTAQLMGFGVAATAIVLACLALLRSAFDGSPEHNGSEYNGSVEFGTAAATAAALFVVAGSIVGRIYRDDRTGVFLSGCALPLIFTSGVLFVPGSLGAAHILLGAAVTAVTAVLALRLGGHGAALFTGTATTAATVVAAATVELFTEWPTSTVGAGAAVVALAGLAAAPRLSMMQARLPLPPVPTAGASLDETNDDDHPSETDLAALSSRARDYLTGLVCAGSAVATAGALLAAFGPTSAEEIYWPGTVLALLTALILLLRGRTFAEVQHAVPLVAGGATVVLVLLIAVVYSALQGSTVHFVVAVAVAVTALVFGSFVPGREYSPVLRRAAELIEYAAIAAVIPMACWVCGLYSAMRAL